MQDLKDILLKLQTADFIFLSKTVATWFSFNSDKTLQSYVAKFESEPSIENRNKVVELLEYHIRYLGSSDIAYVVRYIRGVPPGVPFPQIVSNVAKRLKVKLPIGPRPFRNITPNNDAPSFEKDYRCCSTLLLARNEFFIARKSAALFC